MPFGFRVLRRVGPISGFGSTYVVTLHDDVREVFGTDAALPGALQAEPRRDHGRRALLPRHGRHARNTTPASQRCADVVRAEDLPDAGGASRGAGRGDRRAARAGAWRWWTSSSGASASICSPTISACPSRPKGGSTSGPPGCSSSSSPAHRRTSTLRAQVDEIAPAFRAHIDREIARRKAGGRPARRRAGTLPGAAGGGGARLQRRRDPHGGPVHDRRRPAAAADGGAAGDGAVAPPSGRARRCAAAAALADDDAQLRRYRAGGHALRSARARPAADRDSATSGWRGARSRGADDPEGRDRHCGVRLGDDGRAPRPRARHASIRTGVPHEYIHFGYGLHQCFGRHINGATLHLMLKPLLRRPNLRRAPGPEGHLTKNGPFAERLVVEFG